MVYFCQREASPTTSAEAEQWQRVLKFREQLPQQHLWWPYTQTVEFERLVRNHLEDVVLRRAREREPLGSETPAGAASVRALPATRIVAPAPTVGVGRRSNDQSGYGPAGRGSCRNQSAADSRLPKRVGRVVHRGPLDPRPPSRLTRPIPIQTPVRGAVTP